MLTNWLAKHNDICHYKVESGVLLWHNGVAVTTMNLTDEIALELLNTKNAKHIIQVLPYDNEESEEGTNIPTNSDNAVTTQETTLFDTEIPKETKKKIIRKNK